MSAPRIRTPGQLKVPELKEELRKRGITPKGLKKDLIEKLEEVLRNEGQEHIDNSPDCNLHQLAPVGPTSPQEDYRPLPLADSGTYSYDSSQSVSAGYTSSLPISTNNNSPPPDVDSGTPCYTTQPHTEDGLHCNKDQEYTQQAGSKSYGVDKFQIVQEMRELVTKGMVVKVVHEIKDWNLHFFEQNPILLFQLKQVEFLKLVEDGNYAGALRVARSDLGPLAASYQNLLKPLKETLLALARPEESASVKRIPLNIVATSLQEAYEEFKRVLLAFIYDKDDQTSPVAEEWSEKRRSELAALVASTMKARLRAYDPCFSQTLKYLLSVHNGYCYRQSFTSTISHISKKLLSEERDPPATLQESLYEAPQFKEVDVQALAHAVGLSRQGAIDSLRYTDGNLFAAFQNELSRMKLNVPMVDELVHGYGI